MKADVIILTDNTDVERTKQTIDSLKNAEDIFRIILVSTGKHVEYAGVSVYCPMDEPFNYNRYLNKAFKYTMHDWVVISNDDVSYHPRWFSEMMKVYRKNSDIECFSPTDDVLQKLWFPDLFSDEQDFVDGYEVTRILQGWSITIKRSALNSILPLDEQFDMYYQDNDFAELLKKECIGHAIVRKAKANHQQTHSIGMPMSEDKIKKLAEDEKKFRTKWNIWT